MYPFVAGSRLLSEACKIGLEGIVSKRRKCALSLRHAGEWVKTLCRAEELFLIVGYTAGRRGVTELLLGLADENGELHYVGRVAHGLEDRLARELLSRLEKLRSTEPALAPGSRPKGTKGVVWVKPKLEACVAFRGVSFGHLRHAVLRDVEGIGRGKR